jgi:hypothetical protein
LDTIITVPAFTVTHYIPEVVDGVFKALEDPTPAIREATLSVLKEMLFKLNPASGDEAKKSLKIFIS